MEQNKEQVKEFRCNICGEAFKDEETLRKHRLIHMTVENNHPDDDLRALEIATQTPVFKHQPQPVLTPEPPQPPPLIQR